MHPQRISTGNLLIDQLDSQTVEHIYRSGIGRCDQEELKALREMGKARVRAAAVAPFGDIQASDRELAFRIKESHASLGRLTERRLNFEARLNNAREHTALKPVPRRSLMGLGIAATGVFVLCFAPTINSTCFSGTEDSVLAWVFSIAIGAAMGGFLCMLLLNFEEESCS